MLLLQLLIPPNLELHLPRIHPLNLLQLLTSHEQILNLPDIINHNLRLGVHPCVIAVIQLPVVDVKALEEDGDV